MIFLKVSGVDGERPVREGGKKKPFARSSFHKDVVDGCRRYLRSFLQRTFVICMACNYFKVPRAGFITKTRSTKRGFRDHRDARPEEGLEQSFPTTRISHRRYNVQRGSSTAKHNISVSKHLKPPTFCLTFNKINLLLPVSDVETRSLFKMQNIVVEIRHKDPQKIVYSYTHFNIQSF